jgi:hypothetical protein
MGNSPARRTRAISLGLHPNKLLIPDHRFSFAIDGIEELLPNMDKYHDFASRPQNRPKDYELETKYYAGMLKDLKNPEIKARLALCYRLTKDLRTLTALAEAAPMEQEADLFTKFDGYRQILHAAHDDTVVFIDDTLASHQLTHKLTPAQRLELKRLVELSSETEDKAILKHLVCPKPSRSDKDSRGRTVVLREYLGILRRRAFWARPRLSGLPRNTTNKGDLKLMLGKDPCFQFMVEYNTLLEQLAIPVDGLDRWLPPIELADKAIVFWRKVHDGGRIPKVSWAALSALSIPFSNAAVERSFSQLANAEVRCRLLAGERYVKNMLFFSCNRELLSNSVKTRAKELPLMPHVRQIVLSMFE